VTDTKDTLCLSNSSTSLAKSASERVRRSTLLAGRIFDDRGNCMTPNPVSLGFIDRDLAILGVMY